jgi:hypothetical protein
MNGKELATNMANPPNRRIPDEVEVAWSTPAQPGSRSRRCSRRTASSHEHSRQRITEPQKHPKHRKEGAMRWIKSQAPNPSIEYPGAVVVTGASSGIGRACALKLARS